MSTMKIKVVAVDVGQATSKAGKPYEFVEVTYKNMSFGEKVESKKHNQYGDKTVFNALKSANPGDVFNIRREKDDNGYWQWVGLDVGGNEAAPAKAASSGGATPAPVKGGWETPEERAKKQVYIIRQSSISAAVEALKTDKKALDPQDVIKVAKVFEAYVLDLGVSSDKSEKLPPVDDLEDDIPM